MTSSFDKYMRLPEGAIFAEKYLYEAPRERVDCIVCGGSESRLWYTHGPFNSLICEACGTRYVSPRYDDAQLDDHYSEDLFTSSKDYEGRHHNMLDPRERARKVLDMKEEIEAVTTHVQPGGRVLDIGCQTGIYLEALPDHYEKHGVERSVWAAEHTRSIVDGAIVSGKIEDADFPEGHFDAINMSYVVEHLQYPVETMRHVVRWLRPSGILVISVPNYTSFCSLLFREYFRLADPRQHIYLTSTGSIRHLMDELGLETIKVHRPFWKSHYCNATELKRLLKNGLKRLLLPAYMQLGTTPEVKDLVSPPFWGNLITVVARKPEE